MNHLTGRREHQSGRNFPSYGTGEKKRLRSGRGEQVGAMTGKQKGGNISTLRKRKLGEGGSNVEKGGESKRRRMLGEKPTDHRSPSIRGKGEGKAMRGVYVRKRRTERGPGREKKGAGIIKIVKSRRGEGPSGVIREDNRV